MEIEKFLDGEQIIYHSEDGEQKIYVLPDAKAVEELLAKLHESGVSDTLQLPLSSRQVGLESKEYDTLDDMANRLQAITDTPSAKNLTTTIGEIEELLGEEYLAIDGEQKVYVLPEDVAVDQILGNFQGIRTGEIKQSQMWRKTDIQLGNKEQNDIIAALDQRIKRLEILLEQATRQDTKAKGE